MASVKVDFEGGNNGVAVINMCNPPVNALVVIPIIRGLKERFDEAVRRNDVKVKVLTGKDEKFFGGFEISVMQKVHQTGNYVDLSKQKFSSHVVETCLDYIPESRYTIVHELRSVEEFEHLMQHPFANYVIRSALSVTKGHLHRSLAEAVRQHKKVAHQPILQVDFLQKPAQQEVMSDRQNCCCS